MLRSSLNWFIFASSYISLIIDTSDVSNYTLDVSYYKYCIFISPIPFITSSSYVFYFCCVCFVFKFASAPFLYDLSFSVISTISWSLYTSGQKVVFVLLQNSNCQATPPTIFTITNSLYKERRKRALLSSSTTAGSIRQRADLFSS